MTKRTAISLPDELFRQIERARRRSKKDRSTWIQEAASEYLNKRSAAEDEEAYFAAYERTPLTEDELSLIRWSERNFGKVIDSLQKGSRRGKTDRTR